MNIEELRTLVTENIVDTKQVTDILGCSRENVADLVRRGKLKSVYASPRARLFLRADVLERLKQD